MNQPTKPAPQATEIATTVSPMPAIHVDRFNVGLTDRGILLTFCSPSPVGNQGAFASLPVFAGAMSHDDAQALATALSELLTARTTLQADSSKRN